MFKALNWWYYIFLLKRTFFLMKIGNIRIFFIFFILSLSYTVLEIVRIWNWALSEIFFIFYADRKSFWQHFDISSSFWDIANFLKNSFSLEYAQADICYWNQLWWILLIFCRLPVFEFWESIHIQQSYSHFMFRNFLKLGPFEKIATPFKNFCYRAFIWQDIHVRRKHRK